MTPNEQLRTYLQKVTDMQWVRRRDYRFGCSEEQALAQGSFHTPAALPAGIKRGLMKQCYRNAALLTQSRRDLRYAEGYCLTDIGFPIAHAWCVDSKLRVVEVTLKEVGQAYCGIVFNTRCLWRRLCQRKYYGVFSGCCNEYCVRGFPKAALSKWGNHATVSTR